MVGATILLFLLLMTLSSEGGEETAIATQVFAVTLLLQVVARSYMSL